MLLPKEDAYPKCQYKVFALRDFDLSAILPLRWALVPNTLNELGVAVHTRIGDVLNSLFSPRPEPKLPNTFYCSFSHFSFCSFLLFFFFTSFSLCVLNKLKAELIGFLFYPITSFSQILLSSRR